MEVKRPVITVVGSYAVGMTMKTKRFPICGETLLGKDFAALHGGKGSNQAIEAARLGAEVNFIGCVGKDSFGDSAVELFKEEGINCSCVKRSKDYSTGVGFIIVDDSGHNIIVIDFGANNDIDRKDIDKAEDAIAKSDILLVQLEICMEAVEYAIEVAKRHGVKVVLNPAPFQPLSDKLLSLIDIITPNETEARLLLGMEPDEKVSEIEIGNKLLAKGVKTAIITLGSKGALIVTKEYNETVPVKEVKVLDTTGAGDTFSSSLSVALAEGRNLRDAVEFAGAAASLSVMKYGVVPSLPYREEVEKFLQE